MIAQGRVSENLCTTELAHLSRGDSPYSRPAVHCCLWRMLPTGSENADPPFRYRKQEAECQLTDIPNNRSSSAPDAGRASFPSPCYHEPTLAGIGLGGYPFSQAGRNASLLFLLLILYLNTTTQFFKSEFYSWIILSYNLINTTYKMPQRLW